MTERSFYWRRHLEAIEAEGITTVAYARREGLSLGLLYQWRRKLSALDALRLQEGDPDSSVSSFVRVRVTKSLEPVATHWSLRFRDLELHCPGRPEASWLADLFLKMQREGH